GAPRRHRPSPDLQAAHGQAGHGLGGSSWARRRRRGSRPRARRRPGSRICSASLWPCPRKNSTRRWLSAPNASDSIADRRRAIGRALLFAAALAGPLLPPARASSENPSPAPPKSARQPQADSSEHAGDAKRDKNRAPGTPVIVEILQPPVVQPETPDKAEK